MDNNTVISQLSTDVDNLMHIYQGLAAHIGGGPSGISQLRSQEVRQLGTAIQRLDRHVQTLSREIALDQAQGVRPELDKIYTLTYYDEGWRVHFRPDIAPHFGMEPSRSLREVVERVAKLYPDYRPRLSNSQLEDYARELDHVVTVHMSLEPNLPSEAAKALIACAPPNLPASKRIVLQEQAERAFRNGQGLSELSKQLTQIEHNKQQNQTHQKAQTL